MRQERQGTREMRHKIKKGPERQRTRETRYKIDKRQERQDTEDQRDKGPETRETEMEKAYKIALSKIQV